MTIEPFGEGSYALSAKLKTEIQQMARTIQQNHYKNVNLTGYTDNVFTAAFNATLNQNRAEAVSTQLTRRPPDTEGLGRGDHGRSRVQRRLSVHQCHRERSSLESTRRGVAQGNVVTMAMKLPVASVGRRRIRRALWVPALILLFGPLPAVITSTPARRRRPTHRSAPCS